MLAFVEKKITCLISWFSKSLHYFFLAVYLPALDLGDQYFLLESLEPESTSHSLYDTVAVWKLDSREHQGKGFFWQESSSEGTTRACLECRRVQWGSGNLLTESTLDKGLCWNLGEGLCPHRELCSWKALTEKYLPCLAIEWKDEHTLKNPRVILKDMYGGVHRTMDFSIMIP